jgi:Asp-tRNA(Asn)/Glu-tRNA(Gln) amidotransferase A subunit family amidase
MYDLRLTLPVNLAGLPALAMPAPRRDGPPASLQLIGRSEEVLVATALAL